MKYKNINEAKRLAPPLPAVYAIASYPDIYVGAASSLKQRMIEHSSQLKTRPEKQKRLSAMIKKHGQNECQVFVLHLDDNNSLTTAQLNAKEAAWMLFLTGKGYNVVSSSASLNFGEKNNFFGKTHSEKVKKRLSRKVNIEGDTFGVEFDSGGIAAKAFNISPALVVKRCKNKMTVNGTKWSYGGPEKIQAAIF